MRQELRKKLSEAHWSRERTHPLSAELFRILRASPYTLSQLSELAGVGRETLSHWGHRTNPRLMNFEAALEALGYELKIVRKNHASSNND